MAFWTKKSEEESDTPAISTETGKSPEEKPASGPVPKPTLQADSPKTATAEASASSSLAASASIPALGSIDDSLNQKYGRVRSALGAGTVIQGKLSFDTPVRIDGKLSGEIFSSKALIVGPTGQIDAKVEVSCLVVLGSVKGNVRATERVEILSGGNLQGVIHTPLFVIEDGAKFNGECDMGTRSKVVSVNDAESKRQPQADTNIISDPNIDLGNVLAVTDAAKAEVSKLEASEKEAIDDQPSLH